MPSMSDEPFYSPTWKTTAAPRYRPKVTEPLWELRKDHITWSKSLIAHTKGRLTLDRNC